MASLRALDIICLTETKLCKYIDDSEIDIPGYSVFRKDRNRKGGGIAIYHRDHLTVESLDLSSTPCADLECAAIKISSHLKAMIIACFYRPPKSKAEWISKFHDCADYLHSFNLPLCVIGDFNLNLLADTSFADDLEATYFLKQVIKEPTRITSKSRSLIDHIYLSRNTPVKYSGAFHLHISDHCATYVQICGFAKSGRASSVHVQPRTYRCSKNLNQDNLLKDLSVVPWHIVTDLDTVDDALQTFESLLTDVWDTHAPLKRKQRRRNATPWMTPEVLEQIRRRDTLYRRYEHSRSDVNWVSYKQARNYATKLIRTAKRSFLLKTASDSRNFWKTISRCTGLGRKRHIEPPWPRSSPAICRVTANTVNNFFLSTIENIVSAFSACRSNASTASVSPESTSSNVIGCTRNSFSLRHISPDDVTKAVRTISSPATSVTDKLSLHLLKLSLPAVAIPLANIFNMSIDTACFPSSWKLGQVVPVHKKGNRVDYANYRPITLLPLLSKAMEHAIHQQLKDYLDANEIIHAAQHGFRRNKSCCSALIALSNQLSATKNKGSYSAVAALDYSRAFDTINHNILLCKLANIGFDEQAVAWFSSYLSERLQYVCYNNVKSDLLRVSNGVPQGSVMAPTLYTLYVNDLFALLPLESAVAYADDTTLIASGDSASTAMDALQSLLDIVSNWSTRNCLRLNPEKCVSMCIAPTKQKSSTCMSSKYILTVNDSQIARVQSVKILGVIFTTELDWRQQARSVRAKFSSKLAVLKRIGGSLNTHSRAHVYKTCIKPHVEYCLPVWACCGVESARLDLVLTRAKRIITNSKTVIVDKDDFKVFGLLLFTNLAFLSTVCHYYRHIHSCSPDSAVKLLSQIDKPIKTRATESNKAYITYSKRCCDNCFLFKAPILWNSLPNDITSSQGFRSFYTRIVKFICK